MSIMSTIIAIVCPYIYMVLLTCSVIYLTKKRLSFQTALPLTLLGATLFVFFSTIILHNISLSFWCTVILATSSLVMILRDKDRKETLRNNILTPGFVVFSIIYVFLVALNWFKVVPLLSDTSMHWAPHVWTMWLRNDFYTSPGLSIVNNGLYPPAVQLFELITSKAANVYHEGTLFLAIQILSISMLLPITEGLFWQKNRPAYKQLAMILLLVTSLVLVPLVFFVSDFYASLEVDAILGVVFGYSMYLAIQESKKFSAGSLFKLSIAITFLCLTKQVAVLLAALVVCVYLGGLFVSYRNQLSLSTARTYVKQWRSHWRKAGLVGLIISLPLISMLAWGHQVKGFAQPDPNIAIFHLKPAEVVHIPSILVKNYGSSAQQHFSRAFPKHILKDPGGFLLNNLSMASYAQIVALFVGVMILIWLSTKDPVERQRIFIVTTVATLGWPLYCFALYCVFLFGGMKPVELMGNDVSNRYLRTYLIALFVIAVYFLLRKVVTDFQSKSSAKSVKYFAATLTVTIGLLLNSGTLAVFGIQSIRTHRAEFDSYNIYQTEAKLNYLAKEPGGTFKRPKKILVTASTDNVRHYLQYKALPNRVTLLLFERKTTQDSVCQSIKNSDYFIVGYEYKEPNDWGTIENCLSKVFEPSVGQIYRVVPVADKVDLIRL